MSVVLRPLRRLPVRAVTLAAALAVVGVVLTMAAPAPAAPAPAVDSEGGSAALSATLEAASRGYTDAHTKLVASQIRQARLADEERSAGRLVAALQADVRVLAAERYRGGILDPMMVALGHRASTDTFLERAAMLEGLSRRDTDRIDALREARARLAGQQRLIDAEVRQQAILERAMAARKSDAERALQVSADGFGGGAARAGRAAPRRADGTFAPQSCSLDDPTTSGCITARALNALQQAKVAGFTRFTACFRQASFGEHPKGRACDFSVTPAGFGGVASGAAKTYGNNLANYFIANADRLGVLYVIWFRRIWLPGVGWRAYTRGNGDPSSDHTNHVHLSVE